MKKLIFKLTFFVFIFGLCLVPVLSASALTPGDLGIDYATETGLGTKDVRTTISLIINTALGLLGIIAVVLILYGGLTWMLSAGEVEKVKKAKGIIISGIIGLAIILTAYAIANFVLEALTSAT